MRVYNVEDIINIISKVDAKVLYYSYPNTIYLYPNISLLFDNSAVLAPNL